MFLDTTIIIDLLLGPKDVPRIDKILKHIVDEPLFISIVQLGEIGDWYLANGSDPEKRIALLKEIVNIIPLNEEICLEASEIKFKMRKMNIKKFSLMDGIILASARSINQELLTLDTDFRKAGDAILVE
ncbi:MAG: type II toxin-antitoxin system VapC family toxin [Thermoplasmata archaeon]|nr:type II toxin-antitoxin system VapC family toxin [Thermoplasmata archaeon]